MVFCPPFVKDFHTAFSLTPYNFVMPYPQQLYD